MRRSNRKPLLVAGLVSLVVFIACVCGLWAFDSTNGRSSTPGVEQTEAPDGDCDAGDLRESKPDPDCGGLWLGTPTPAAKKTTAPAAPKKTPGPRRTR